MVQREFNDVLCEEGTRLREVARALHRLSTAHYATGNNKLARDLLNIADAVYDSQDALSLAYGRMLNDQFSESTQQMGHVLTALVQAGDRG